MASDASGLHAGLDARGLAVWRGAFDGGACDAMARQAAGQAMPAVLPPAWRTRLDGVRDTLAALAARWRGAPADPGLPLAAWVRAVDAEQDAPLVTSGDADAGFGLLLVVLLNRPGVDFDGGELVLAEQRPRMQTRPHVVPLQQGDLAVIAAAGRPVQGARGPYRVTARHGVARVRGGTRIALMAGWPLARVHV
ncbi:2OG-Fe(II) oxygenase [Bordetella genomosp. 1]|nr:2OG-Fe(II) oxygenase [Bordetella genomosp. 1]